MEQGYTLVIARYNEDISWSEGLNKVVIQKGTDIPNIGREISSYLWFILSNYDILKGEYIFVQGYPFDHDSSILNHLFDTQTYGIEHTCDKHGNPDHPSLNLHEIAQELDLPVLDTYLFKAGAQHRASAEQIRNRPYEWYAKAYYLSLIGQNPYCFERLIPYIYSTQ